MILLSSMSWEEVFRFNDKWWCQDIHLHIDRCMIYGLDYWDKWLVTFGWGVPAVGSTPGTGPSVQGSAQPNRATINISKMSRKRSWTHQICPWVISGRRGAVPWRRSPISRGGCPIACLSGSISTVTSILQNWRYFISHIILWTSKS